MLNNIANPVKYVQVCVYTYIWHKMYQLVFLLKIMLELWGAKSEENQKLFYIIATWGYKVSLEISAAWKLKIYLGMQMRTDKYNWRHSSNGWK